MSGRKQSRKQKVHSLILEASRNIASARWHDSNGEDEECLDKLKLAFNNISTALGDKQLLVDSKKPTRPVDSR